MAPIERFRLAGFDLYLAKVPTLHEQVSGVKNLCNQRVLLIEKDTCKLTKVTSNTKRRGFNTHWCKVCVLTLFYSYKKPFTH